MPLSVKCVFELMVIFHCPVTEGHANPQPMGFQAVARGASSPSLHICKAGAKWANSGPFKLYQCPDTKPQHLFQPSGPPDHVIVGLSAEARLHERACASLCAHARASDSHTKEAVTMGIELIMKRSNLLPRRTLPGHGLWGFLLVTQLLTTCKP
jgi:hypothetical protein